MDEFKKYLQQSAKDMDVDAPGEDTWQRIQTTKAGKKKTPIRSLVFRIAAAACVIAVAYLGLKNYLTTTPIKTEIPVTAKTDNLIAPEKSTNIITVDTVASIDIIKSKKAMVKPVAVKKTEKKLSQPEQLLQSFENNYAKLVALQLNTIRSTPVYNETEDYFDDLKKQFRQAENDETDIKSTIKKSGLTDELLEQLIAVYQQKINLLKTLQNQITRINKKVKENHSVTDSLKTSFINI
jgi:hypothetical protein